jgi:putative transposase
MRDRKIIRLKGYDYSADNLYFITSCVKDRVCCFGEIVSVDETGRIDGMGGFVGTGRDPSLQCDPSLQHHPSIQSNGQCMILNEYGKIAEKQWYWLGKQYPYVALHSFVVMPNHIHGIIEINRNIVGTGHNPSQLKIKSLSELMGAYKTTVSKQIHLAGLQQFAWQRSFYEHIIRDDKSFEIISLYIERNPAKWDEDKFNGN